MSFVLTFICELHGRVHFDRGAGVLMHCCSEALQQDHPLGKQRVRGRLKERKKRKCLADNRMASACHSDDESVSSTDSDVSDGSDSAEFSDEDDDSEGSLREPCKFYNRGNCRKGRSCPYLHVCKYALEGNCRYGSRCRLDHTVSGGASSGASSRALDLSSSSGSRLTDGRYYQWQLRARGGWKDVENDHILEAQYSLPHIKSIKIYNTQYGAVSIDFKRMCIHGKKLGVRRLDDGKTVWIWYCMVGRKWIEYGAKDSKGNSSPLKSSDIEEKFQSNPTGSETVNINGESFEIKFKGMQQVGQNRKRKVTRRPLYRQPQAAAGVSQAASLFQNLLRTTPQWEFEGDSGKWHKFKHRSKTSTECSITSDDIERNYQQNSSDPMLFTVAGQSYKLDFGAMIQTNLGTNHTRRVRRKLV